MATPKETIWDIEPHTIAKHKILKVYLDAWYPILKSISPRLNYIDGFAGPGKYSKGELGSPLVVIDLTLKQTSLSNVELNFVFIEENLPRKINLKNEINLLILPSNFKIEVINGEFHNVIGGILDGIESQHQTLAPTFVFIDPFGFSGIPFTIIERLLKIPRVEVFITFMVNPITRFVADEKNNQHIIELFGSEEIVEIVKRATTLNRYDILRLFYQNQLKEKARAGFVRYFSMKNSEDRPIYDLFFATNHRLGHIKMKEAMWNVDKEGHYRFSDSTDQNQTALFQRDVAKELFDIINKNRSKDKYEVKTIKKYVEDKTAFLEKHMKESLRYAEKNDLIKVEPIKSNGEKRHGKTFPDDVIVNFI